jgi:uncharacterized protein YgfB (UPF0149 family)
VEPSELPSHEEVAGEIAELRLGTDASELHGSLCGLLSAGAEVRRDDWWLRLALEPALAPRSEGALDQLFLASQVQLTDPDLGFSLLLPEEDSPLAERAEGLLAWCRGFLGGFGLGAVANAALSPEAGEALDDLSKIAASRLSYDDPEGDEAALIEVAEFVRVAALLLHGDCNHAGRPPRLLH